MEDDALTRRVLACCYTVHRELGAGFPETSYQRAVTREMEHAGLAFTCEVWIPVYFRGEEIDRVHADFIVDRILLEIRSKHSVDKDDIAQTFACVRAAGLPRGLLVNFGADELQVKRFATSPRIQL
jgi:GxxExxY protein